MPAFNKLAAVISLQLDNRIVKSYLQNLYTGNNPKSRTFRVALFSFDIITILFFIVSSMLEQSTWIFTVDYIIGVVLLVEYLLRLWISDRRLAWCFQFHSLADIIVIASLFASAFIDNLSFLRVVRMLRLVRSYHVLHDLRSYSPWFKRNEEIIESSLNLFIFVFVISAIVFVVEEGINPHIKNYLDALYFTVTTLTTTGFGDITMADTTGRVLSIFIMVIGVSLFLRLVQTIFRPNKVRFPCPDCGLLRHDPDAVHCKHCGRVLNIVSEGY